MGCCLKGAEDEHPITCPQVNKATAGLLKRIEPFIAFGNPSLKSVKELIYKRGYAKVCYHACMVVHPYRMVERGHARRFLQNVSLSLLITVS